MPFPVIFAKIAGEKRSGVLSLADTETNKMKKRIGFKGGYQAYVAGGTIYETLGRLLLRWGKISEQQYQESLALQKKEKKRTGEVLIAMKILDGTQLAEALQMQIEEKILGCFILQDGPYSFIEASPPADKQLLFFQIRPEKLVMEGVRRHFNKERLEKFLKPLAGVKFHRSEQFSEIVQKMILAPKESRVAQSIKENMGFQDILAATQADQQMILQVIFAMLSLQVIEPIIAKAAPSPASSTAAPKPQPARSEPEPVMAVQHSSQAAAARHDSPNMEEPPAVGESAQVVEEDADEGGAQFSIEGEDGAGSAEAPEEFSRTIKKKIVPVAGKKITDPEELKRREEILKEIEKHEEILKTGTFFDLLGVKRDDSAQIVKKAFFRLAKKFHPDTNPAFFVGEFRERAEIVFTRVGEAYNTLIDKKAREEYIFALDHNISKEDIERANKALEAEDTFLKAEVLFKKGDFRGAQTTLEEAIRLNPDEPEYFVYLGWCQFKSTHGAALAGAKQTIQKSIDMGLRDKIDMANYYLGMFAKVEGKPVEEQRKYFAAAVQANPSNSLAASELRHIEMRGGKAAAAPEKEKESADKKKGGGLFSRFKK